MHSCRSAMKRVRSEFDFVFRLINTRGRPFTITVEPVMVVVVVVVVVQEDTFAVGVAGWVAGASADGNSRSIPCGWCTVSNRLICKPNKFRQTLT